MAEGRQKNQTEFLLKREKYWQDYWEKNAIYRFNPHSKKPPFTVDTPPPTVSGKLHLGHVFSYTQAEVIVRYHRMKGENIFYPLGLDNNGLPTELLIEKDCSVSANKMPAEEFRQLVLDKLPQYHQAYLALFRSLGFSYDYSLLYETISPATQKLVLATFRRLKERGLIYKAKKPALYCWRCQTSVAQAEVEDKELPGVFYTIKFSLADRKNLPIATTRPELLPAIVAVFVHPDDPRYQSLIGGKATTPLGDSVPIIAEREVDREKGTGAVMICSYGDETDLALIKKHRLPEKITFDERGRLLADYQAGLQGLTLPQAREKLVSWLEKEGALLDRRPLTHAVGVHERCGTPIEILPRRQYFVKLLPFKKEILARGAQVNWHPRHMRKRFVDWVENLKWDWCISRERYYGIAIPGEKNLFFDTWFTSAQTPAILKARLPMSFRPQAHDIIRTWAFYTIAMTVLLEKSVPPWRDLMISGHILAKKGAKISKRTGGGAYSPPALIQGWGADCLRYAMCQATLGKDSFFEEKQLREAKRIVTKLVNASRLIFPRLSGDSENCVSHPLDKWLVVASERVAKQMGKELDSYHYNRARLAWEKFFWNVFCDNYLELVKFRLYRDDPSALSALRTGFLNILKMLAPFMPHIAEELYQQMPLAEKQKSIHLAGWVGKEGEEDKELDKRVAVLFEAVSLMRKGKSERGISLGKEVEAVELPFSVEKQQLLQLFLPDFLAVSRAKRVVFSSGA